jgi:hypothetical protein
MCILLLIILILKLFVFNHLTHLDFFPLSINENISFDDSRKTQVTKAFHESVQHLNKEK